jgi:hypothetical protein
MASATYYRLQARVFALWALAATNPATAQRLRNRAAEYVALADQLDQAVPPSHAPPRPVAQQQQQIQPDSGPDNGGAPTKEQF